MLQYVGVRVRKRMPHHHFLPVHNNRDTDGYICIHLWVCEPSRDKARDAFSASLVTLSNVSLMQTSVLDNHFKTLSYFLYSWGLNRGENGLWVQSWDRWQRKTRN